MIYEFKSRATGTVVMTAPVAERLLGIIGKAPGASGAITPAQMPAAIQALEAAAAAAAAERRTPEPPPASQAQDDDADADAEETIGLAQRAWPLIEMLKAAAAADRDITWGV